MRKRARGGWVLRQWKWRDPQAHGIACSVACHSVCGPHSVGKLPTRNYRQNPSPVDLVYFMGHWRAWRSMRLHHQAAVLPLEPCVDWPKTVA